MKSTETSAYIKRLMEAVAKEEEEEEARFFDAPHVNVVKRIECWHKGLPAISRNRLFSMDEISKGVGAHSQILGAALHDAGWTQGRRWTTTGRNIRWWAPPGVTAPGARRGRPRKAAGC